MFKNFLYNVVNVIFIPSLPPKNPDPHGSETNRSSEGVWRCLLDAGKGDECGMAVKLSGRIVSDGL